VTQRVAAIDCGTNSIRLLVADVDPRSGTLRDLDRRMEIVRLGHGVDATRRIAPESMARTFDAVERYAEVVRALGAERIRFVATSASRDAENSAEFVSGVLDRIGVAPEVVSGDEEARLSFLGATRGLADDAQAPYLVVDIGGGSTELVLGVHEPAAAASVDVGCVRLTERHARHDPPSAQEIDAILADIDEAIARAARTVPLGEARTLIGLAGSVTTLTAIALGQTEYDADAIHGARVSAAQVAEVSDRLLALDHAGRSVMQVIHPGRVDVLNAGILVLRRILDVTGLPEVLASEHDILDGVAWSLTV
jgi:exopolyphosphatase/guanosine-5'-triphosphate,3'-diphosphate pyrophosphatase